MANKPMCSMDKKLYTKGFCGVCSTPVESTVVEWVGELDGTHTPLCPTCKADLVFAQFADAEAEGKRLRKSAAKAAKAGKALVITAYRVGNPMGGVLRTVFVDVKGNLCVHEAQRKN